MKRYSMKKRLSIVLILIFFVCFGVSFFGQEKKGDDDKNLEKEILAVYKTKGERGLRDFAKENINRLTAKFIVDFAESGVKERNEEWLKVCEILAEEKKDEKTLADVYLKLGEYFRLISDNKKSLDFFENSLPIYVKLNDFVGQGNAYVGKGKILSYSGDNTKANELYDKALLCFKKTNNILGQGRVYYNKGSICRFTGENLKALKLFDKALTFFEKSGSSLSQGNTYMRKGEIYSIVGKYSKAQKLYDKALLFFEKSGDLLGQGNIYWNKGEIYLRSGNNPEALAMYEKALPFYERARDPMSQGNVYWRKGDTYFYTGDNSNALEMHDKALISFEKANAPVGKGNVYLSKGIIYSYIDDNPKALEMYDKAITFFEKAGFPIGLGNVYRCKGNVYFYTGDNSRALELYDKALLFSEKAEDTINQGNVYHSKGEIYLRTGEISVAIEMYNKALRLFVEAGSPLSQGNAFYSKGEVYLRAGNNSGAFKLFDQALYFYEKAGSPIGQGNVYLGKADIYFRIGNHSSAFKMYDKALLFYKKAGDHVGQGNVYYNKGEIYLINSDYSNAIEMYNKAMPLFEKSGEPNGQGNVYKSKGDIFYYNYDNSGSLEMYNKALAFYIKVGDVEAASYTLYGKAKIFERQKRKKEAMTLFEKYILNLENVRRQTTFYKLQKTFLEKVYDLYEEAAVFMLENGYYDKVFKYADSMKSRVFLDQLAEGLIKLDKGLAQELTQKRDEFVSRLSALSKQISEAAGKKDEKKLGELKEKRRKVEYEFEDLLIKIRLENPLYASVRYPEPVSLKSLRKKVLKKGELMLRFFTAEEKTYVFLVSRKKFKVIPLNITSKEIQKRANRYLLSMKDKSKKKLNEYGMKLYQSLFKPLEPLLNGKKNLIIIPDGQLATIPFESFVIGKNKAGKPVYLLEKYKIKYIQSASVLSTLRKHYKRTGKTKHFIGFGDPVYDYENFKKSLPEKGITNPVKGDEIKEIHRGKYDREGGVMNRLQGSGQEVQTIAGLFQAQDQKTVIHLRETASEENAKSPDLKGFDYIHFSCHGILGDGFQSLVLSQNPEAKEDGYLTLNEIMNCDYNAKLVVLSACQTGTGKVERGEGVTGLTRAVMYAGTPAVVASLWNVSDIGTKELMVKFYTNMLEKGMSKEDALREAKLSLLRGGKYSSPYYWSSFVMYGE